MRVVEVCPVVDGRLLGRRTAEDFGPPGVEVAVEVDDRDGTVGGRHASQQGKGDGVVAAQGDDSRQRFAFFRGTGEVSAGGRRSGEELIVAQFDLFESVGVVVGCHGYVAAVEYGGPGVERVGIEGDVVAAAEANFA